MEGTVIDIGFLRGLGTVIALLAFLGVVAWAYGKRSQEAFKSAARLPLEEDDDSSEKQKSPKISGSSVTSKKSGSVNGNGVTEPEIAKKRGRPLNKDLKKKQSRSPAKRSSSVAASSSSSLSASPATEDDLLLIDKKRRKRDGDSTSTFLGNFKL